MIRLSDAMTLARTKRKTHRVRGALTTVIAGLLFSLLFVGVVVLAGVQTSLHAMYQKSMAGRYIISGYQQTDYDVYHQAATDTDLITQAQAQYDKLVADKKAAAKKLGIQYDPTSEPLPYVVLDKSTGEKQLDESSPIAQKLIQDWVRQKQPTRTLDDFKKFAAAYHPTAYYTSLSFSPRDGQWKEMKNGKESFDASSTQTQNQTPDDYTGAQLAPEALTRNYLLTNYSWKPESGHIPVVVTQKRAAQLTGFAVPKKDASAQEKLHYYQKLREKAVGATMTLCYRNSTSLTQVSDAMATKKLLAAHAGDKDFQKPPLVYDMPDPTSCGSVITTSDTRTTAEKQLADKQKQFDAQFSPVTEAAQQKITLEVVGISPNGWEDMDGGFSVGADGLVASMMMVQMPRMVIPQELYEKIPQSFGYNTIFATRSEAKNVMDFYRGGVPTYFAEFSDASAARDFTKKESCNYGPNGCTPKEKFFALTPFGSNSLAVEDVSSTVLKVLMWVGLGVMLLAAIFASLMIGRTIADSRRETAVFRAIGFKRLDITGVYAAYTVLLCLDIIFLMIIVGVIGALAIDHFLWVDTTARLQVLLGLSDVSTQFHYYGVSWYLGIVMLAVFGAGFIGLIVPLIRSIRRNPIRDMRDE